MAVNVVTLEDLDEFRDKITKDIVSIITENLQLPGQQWLKSDEVKRLLKISPNTLQMMREKYNLPYTKVGGVIFYAQADIIKILEDNKVGAKKSPAESDGILRNVRRSRKDN
jgi:hypothetical protein